VRGLEQELRAAEAQLAEARTAHQKRASNTEEVGRGVAELERKHKELNDSKQALLTQVTRCNAERPDDDSELARTRDECLSEVTTQSNELRARITDLATQVRCSRVYTALSLHAVRCAEQRCCAAVLVAWGLLTVAGHCRRNCARRPRRRRTRRWRR